jgi:hypothetical protein
MDLIVRLFLRLGVLLQPSALKPIPVPVTRHPRHPGAPR